MGQNGDRAIEVRPGIDALKGALFFAGRKTSRSLLIPAFGSVDRDGNARSTDEARNSQAACGGVFPSVPSHERSPRRTKSGPLPYQCPNLTASAAVAPAGSFQPEKHKNVIQRRANTRGE